MPPKKPLVIVTRKLPDVIETRMMELFDARLNLDDTPMTQAQLVAAVQQADVLVPTVTDRIDAAVLAQAGPAAQAHRLVRHRRRPCRPRRGAHARHHRDQYARRPHRGHRRHDHGADPRRVAPPDRGRAADPAGQVAGLGPDLHARPSDLGQAARHPRHGPHRPGGRPPRPGLRPFDPLPQPPPRTRGRRAGTRGDVLGEPRPDAGADGHRLGQLPAHAGDVSPALGAATASCCGRMRSSSTRRAAR